MGNHWPLGTNGQISFNFDIYDSTDAGGCGTASKFVNKFAPGEVCVIDPASEHYYQPMWTLVGGGAKNLSQSVRPMKSVLPSKATWLQAELVTGSESSNGLLWTFSVTNWMGNGVDYVHT